MHQNRKDETKFTLIFFFFFFPQNVPGNIFISFMESWLKKLREQF